MTEMNILENFGNILINSAVLYRDGYNFPRNKIAEIIRKCVEIGRKKTELMQLINIFDNNNNYNKKLENYGNI
jgi:hypothetical protein